jgi:hypothetical protein
MQTFDESTLNRVFSAPPLTVQSLEYGREDMPFMAFGGTEKPRTVVREYNKGEFDPANKFGPLGRGAYNFKYGDTWAGEPAVYDTRNFQEQGKDGQMMHMTLAAKKESMAGAGGSGGGALGPVITKNGRKMCTPGYVMKNGVCVMEPEVSVCQPGWYKQNGICVKGNREFMAGAPSGDTSGRDCNSNNKLGPMGSAAVANQYPQTTPDVLSMQRLRQYMEEKQVSPVHAENSTAGTSIAVVVFVLFVLLVLVPLLYGATR